MSRWDIPEISDLIVDYDPLTLQRKPVHRQSALQQCTSRYGRTIIQKIPHQHGILDPHVTDQMLVQAHEELQRLWEEFFHGPRVACILQAMVAALRATGLQRRLRVVDIGCGPGFVLRWLSAHRILQGQVEWVGVDYNAALIARAQQLANQEGLTVQFMVANAFRLDEPADIFLSSGVLHHFRGQQLQQFFRQQANCQPMAFAHFDPQASWAAPIGSFLFHVARMRSPLARYDGWLSAARAHPGPILEQAAQENNPQLAIGRYNPAIPWLPFLRTLTGIIAIIPAARAHLQQHLREPMAWLS